MMRFRLSTFLSCSSTSSLLALASLSVENAADALSASCLRQSDRRPGLIWYLLATAFRLSSPSSS